MFNIAEYILFKHKKGKIISVLYNQINKIW